MSFFSSALISSQRRFTSSAVFAEPSPKTCGCRRISFSLMASSESSMRELAFFGRHLGEEDGLEHQVAELFGQAGPIALVDGVQHFVGLFEQIGLDGVEGLFAIPRAAAGSAQPGHDADQALKTFASCGLGLGHSGVGSPSLAGSGWGRRSRIQRPGFGDWGWVLAQRRRHRSFRDGLEPGHHLRAFTRRFYSGEVQRPIAPLEDQLRRGCSGSRR